MMEERKCCGTFEGTPHRNTCRPNMIKEITRLTAQLDASRTLLAERDAEIALLRQQSVGWVQVFDENATLREEVEKIKYDRNCKHDLAAEQIEALEHDVVEARKLVAQEIVDMLRADRWAESELKDIIEKFGLEG